VCDSFPVNFPALSAEHPTLTELAETTVDLLSNWQKPTGSAWLHHDDFAQRTRRLAEHLRAALLLADSALYRPSLAIARTALEHHLLDRLILLTDRFETTEKPWVGISMDDFEVKVQDQPDVLSTSRTKSGDALRIVRKGHDVLDREQNELCERISPCWTAFEQYDPFLGHPALLGSTVRPFRTPETRKRFATGNQRVYSDFLKWKSILSNLVLNLLVTEKQIVQLKVHYAFLSGFAHSTVSSKVRDFASFNGPTNEHVLGELVLLYCIVLGNEEIGAWAEFVRARPRPIGPLDREATDHVNRAQSTVAYFWFLSGAPQPFDFYQAANARVALPGDEERPSNASPVSNPEADILYYDNPIDRLSRMHVGESEMMSGQSVAPAWPTLRW
jgi:hypothetical protein